MKLLDLRKYDPTCLREDVNPDLFFGREGERRSTREAREERAKAVCADCPAKEECLKLLMTMRPSQMQGIMAGLTPSEYREVYMEHIKAG